jgi:hypothetical protein
LAFPFLVIILSFLEFIVFNEEVLLYLCFFSFVFLIYQNLNQSISEFFEDNSNNIEKPIRKSLLIQYVFKQDLITTMIYSIKTSFFFFKSS